MAVSYIAFKITGCSARNMFRVCRHGPPGGIRGHTTPPLPHMGRLVVTIRRGKSDTWFGFDGCAMGQDHQGSPRTGIRAGGRPGKGRTALAASGLMIDDWCNGLTNIVPTAPASAIGKPS